MKIPAGIFTPKTAKSFHRGLQVFQSLLQEFNLLLGQFGGPFSILTSASEEGNEESWRKGSSFLLLYKSIFAFGIFSFFSGWSIIGKSSLDDFCSTIFEPLKKITFLGYWGFVPIFSHQIKLGLFTQLDQGPFQLIDLLTSGCQGPSHHQPNHPKGPWGIGRCCALSCQPFEESSVFYWLHFCNEHHFLGRFYQLHNSKSLITCSGPVLHMPSELGHQCIFCFWRHWWTLTRLMYHNASKWAHPSQKS